MAEEGNYSRRPRRSLPSNITFVPEGEKIPVKKHNPSTEYESYGHWKVAADLSGYQGFFPVPTSKRPDLVVRFEEKK